MNENKREKAQAAFDNGGLLAEEVDDKVKIHLAIDPKNPLQVFDRLNELEVDLVRKAGNDIELIKKAGDFIDELREKTTQMLKSVGIDAGQNNGTKKDTTQS
jgi:hypothetical protein